MMNNDTLPMFWYYTKTTIKSWFQYKVDAFLRSIAVFLREATGIIVIYLTLAKFDNINGWDINEMMFLFSLVFVTYGIMIIFFTGLRDFGWLIQQGGLDRLMLRPRGLLFQIIASNSDWFAALGHGGLGITLFIISANRAGIDWNAKTIIYYVFTIIGGILIQGAIFLFFASLCFYLIKSENLREIFFWKMRRFAMYPISIYHKIIQYILIYVVPFAFVNYFPSQYLLRKDDMQQYPQLYIYIAPLLGIALYAGSYAFWRFSIRFYKGTGN